MLQSDFQDILITFVYSNLPALMNPASAVVVTDVPVAGTPDTVVITPEVLSALRPYVLNNFSDLGLPPDIQEIVRQFFALNDSIA